MADRPVECTHCKKPVKVIYKEIVDKTITRTEMCADCPVLEQKLHGEALSIRPKERGKGAISCGNCFTTLESVRTSNPLGCSECYNVFADTLVTQLLESNALPSRLKKTLAMKRSQKLHVGRGVEKAPKLASSSRLVELHEALNEALKRENYEQAAWLRDQIKELEKPKPKDERKG